MKKIILVVGYTKIENIQSLKQIYGHDFRVACAYGRRPDTQDKNDYLLDFDLVYDLEEEEDVDQLRRSKELISAVTCLQERDMSAYLSILSILDRINPEQFDLYQKSINKAHMKAYLDLMSPGLVPRHHKITDVSSLSKIDYPTVLKPTGNAGSRFVYVAKSKEEAKNFLEKYHTTITSQDNSTFDRPSEIIAEDFIMGNQYSVNVYIDAAGTPTICPVIRVVPATELGFNDCYSALQYVTNELSEDQLSSLANTISKIITLFQLKDTSAHFDMVLSNDGWKCFEIGLRIGGGRRTMFRKSHNFDHLLNDIDNRLGRPTYIPEQKSSVCIVQKGVTDKGTVVGLRYQRGIDSLSQGSLLQEDKFSEAIGKAASPVSEGGPVVARFILVAEDEKKLIGDSLRVFESLEINLADRGG